MSRRVYTARFAPVAQACDVPGEGRRVTVSESFDRYCFVAQRNAPESIPILIRHMDNAVAGHVTNLHVTGGWWTADFELDHTLLGGYAQDLIRVGTSLSAGYLPLRAHEVAGGAARAHTQAQLVELSILPPDGVPRFRGAEVVRVIDIPQARRAPRRNRATPSTEPAWLPAAQQEAAGRGRLVRVFTPEIKIR